MSVVLGLCEKEGEEEGLSPEEKDNLSRSTKKPKVHEEESSYEGIVVMETPPPLVEEHIEEPKPLFETDTNMRLKRKVVSYKDVILGVNGGSSGSFEEEDNVSEDDMESDDSISSEEEHHPAQIDPLCPEIFLSKEEHRYACKQWKNSIILKLLRKRIGFRALHLRLLKLWNPLGDMELIDLENDYFLEPAAIADDVRMDNGKERDNFGPWMLVQRNVWKKSAPNKRNGVANDNPNMSENIHGAHTNAAGGSRFSALVTDEANIEQESPEVEHSQPVVESTPPVTPNQPHVNPSGNKGPKTITQVKQLARQTGASSGTSITKPISKISEPKPNSPNMVNDSAPQNMEIDPLNKPTRTMPKSVNIDPISKPLTNPSVENRAQEMEVCNGRPPNPTSSMCEEPASVKALENKEENVPMDVSPVDLRPRV
ncbi:hypothetical protein SESBI_33960 [Sesbania bispinosa]|nr:hypothetical protein SESBI_33960 [Sesbania bispinosa]